MYSAPMPLIEYPVVAFWSLSTNTCWNPYGRLKDAEKVVVVLPKVTAGLVIGVGLVVVTETAVETADRAPLASTALTVKLWVEPGVRSPMCTDVIVSGTSRSREVPS